MTGRKQAVRRSFKNHGSLGTQTEDTNPAKANRLSLRDASIFSDVIETKFGHTPHWRPSFTSVFGWDDFEALEKRQIEMNS